MYLLDVSAAVHPQAPEKPKVFKLNQLKILLGIPITDFRVTKILLWFSLTKN